MRRQHRARRGSSESFKTASQELRDDTYKLALRQALGVAVFGVIATQGWPSGTPLQRQVTASCVVRARRLDFCAAARRSFHVSVAATCQLRRLSRLLCAWTTTHEHDNA